MARRRILYVQYTNPAGYPPLEHSSRILAKARWDVRFVGTQAQGAAALRLEPHPRIEVLLLRFQPRGWRQKAHYLAFAAWSLWHVVSWRPRWLYASDIHSAPVALIASFLPFVRVCYHEHDSPGSEARASAFMKAILWARRMLARRAEFCVLPNAGRIEHFSGEVRTARPVFCVWNCPSVEEVARAGVASPEESFALLYHGSIVPQRLPLAILDAMARLPETVRLHVLGYETLGSPGYTDRLRERARELGIEHRVRYEGAVATRAELLGFARQSQVGLALMPLQSADINQRHMEGASNKPFEYLASGLALLISDIPAWKRLFAEPGFALACDPEDVDSIHRALRDFHSDAARTRRMGEVGRERVVSEWNYEHQFEPVLRYLEAEGAR